MTNNEIWQSILAEFELKISKANFITWFGDTGILDYTEGKVDICVPNQFTKSWLEKKYHTELIALIEKVTGKPVRKITYIVDNIKKIGQQNTSDSNKNFFTKKSPTSTESANVKSSHQNFSSSSGQLQFTNGGIFNLNPNYTFDTFIVGKNNELAHAAAQAVANRPGEAYNPLFIYGGVGLGKTHLLQAIAHSMLESNPKTKFLYVTSEKFTNEFISAVQQKRISDFKDKYRGVDLLLIDDIQFIGGKEQTQEEFFHTFNELHQQRKQVVLTSDRPPKAIPSLEDRLRSRFEWGMITDISMPDLETRVAILQSKCLEKNFNINEELLHIIASTIQSNIRELEGALNKVIAFHELKNIYPTIETVRSIISSLETLAMRPTVGVKELIDAVIEFYGIQSNDLFQKNRARQISKPRQIIMYLLRTELNLSYPSIGDELGGRDHTTAIHAHNKIQKSLDKDEKLKQELEIIKQRLYSNNPH